MSKDQTQRKAYFAAGCFWGVEHLFQQLPGVKEVTSGYMGGETRDPTYEEVCQKNTGHLETVEVAYDPNQISYYDLVKFFFEIHDPEQANGQGPDIGPQYLSAIFYDGDKEKAVASYWKQQLQNLGYQPVTQLIPKTEQTPFYPAEAYHQDYYQKTGKAPYCHRYQPKFNK